ncbi:NUDIX domain-containing protein [Kocuria sp. CPCC 204721]|uniref:NUDIX hydrolase n=1 Tax=Kocuria sp. CPCC 204721 TaxID=3073548 RepID=UPI0034D53FC1
MTDQRVLLAVSTVIFTVRPTGENSAHELWLPLVRRIRDPYRGMWALPGGPLRSTEDLEDSALRSLTLTTGLAPTHLEQLATFGGLTRSAGAEERQVTVVYWASLPPHEAAMGENDLNVTWLRVTDLPDLAFDHSLIVAHALEHLRGRIAEPTVARAFLPETFTIAALREVHEAIISKALDPPNFRRHVLSSGQLRDTGERLAGARHRPPTLYRFAAAKPPGLFRPSPSDRTEETP